MQTQELEAKFLIANGKRPKRVLRRIIQELSWAGYRIRPKGSVRVKDRYLDTRDWCLQRTGWSYRLRNANGKKTLTLKQLGGGRGALFERREIEQPARNDRASHPRPGPVATQLDELLGSHRGTINELFVLNNLRRRYLLTHPDYPGGAIELSLDRVRIKSEYTLRFAELEFELRHGDREFLVDLVSIIQNRPNLITARLGKYQRGLFAAACVTPQRKQAKFTPKPDSRWLDVGRRHLTIQLELLKAYEPFAYEAIHPEGVHELRVISRRIRAALGIFAPVLPKTSLSRDVRKLGRVLGRVRDIDVQVLRLRDYRETLGFDGRRALDVYERQLLSRRSKAHNKLIESLEGYEYSKLLSGYQTLLDENHHPTERQRRLKVVDATRNYVKPQLKRVLKKGASLSPKSPPQALHNLRIEVKKLRYQIEHLGAPGRAIKRARKSLSNLQETLGHHQDAWVARSELNRYRRQHDLSRSESKAFKKLAGFERNIANRWRQQFGKNWQQFEADAKRLKKALG